MTLNNFTPDNTMLKRAKVLESPDLREILKKMEDGEVIRSAQFWYAMGNRSVSIRNIRTLETAGLIEPVEFDDYIEYRLTYRGSFEELVRGAK